MSEKELACKDENNNVEKLKKVLASRDEVERFKPYIEVVKYAISTIIALIAICGIIIRIRLNNDDVSSISIISYLAFIFGIILNLYFFVLGHRLVSAAMRNITHELTKRERDKALRRINHSSYSLFVGIFLILLVYWTLTISIIAIM